jgi:hypothetical protein
MRVEPITTSCEQARAAHFRLEMDAWEIEALESSPTADDSRLEGRERIITLGNRFLQNTLDVCEVCEQADTSSCPNDGALEFIINTLTS